MSIGEELNRNKKKCNSILVPNPLMKFLKKCLSTGYRVYLNNQYLDILSKGKNFIPLFGFTDPSGEQRLKVSFLHKCSIYL